MAYSSESDEITFNCKGTTKTWTIGGTTFNTNIAENKIVLHDLFEDDTDTYTTDNTNDIDSIDFLDTDNFAAGDLETLDAEKILQTDLTTSTFGQDRKDQ